MRRTRRSWRGSTRAARRSSRTPGSAGSSCCGSRSAMRGPPRTMCSGPGRRSSARPARADVADRQSLGCLLRLAASGTVKDSPGHRREAMMRVPRIRLLVCGAVAVLTAPTLATAPAAGDSRYVLVARPALPPPAPDRTTIVLVREQFARAKPMPQKNLFLDGAPLGLLMQKTLVIAQVTRGMHAIQASSDCVPLAFEAEAGETRMFRLREVINDLDIAETSWIEDDPSTFDELVRKEGLRESRLGPDGRPFLQEKVHKLD